MLVGDDYEIDEEAALGQLLRRRHREARKTCCARPACSKGQSLYDIENVAIVHHINNALKAHKLFTRDKDYIVRNDEIVIIDEFTGRMMPGRRYSEGQHQALEAKERCRSSPRTRRSPRSPSRTTSACTRSSAGMTGTASTEAEEFGNIYGLEVIEVPTNLPIKRIDEDDEVYRTVEEKYKAIINEIKDGAETRPADSGRHDLDREVGIARRAPAESRASRTSRFSTPATTSRKPIS